MLSVDALFLQDKRVQHRYDRCCDCRPLSYYHINTAVEILSTAAFFRDAPQNRVRRSTTGARSACTGSVVNSFRFADIVTTTSAAATPIVLRKKVDVGVVRTQSVCDVKLIPAHIAFGTISALYKRARLKTSIILHNSRKETLLFSHFRGTQTPTRVKPVLHVICTSNYCLMWVVTVVTPACILLL